MPIGNCIISLEDLVFSGNQTINNLHTLLEELFRAVRTVSIEGFDRRYTLTEIDALIAEIEKLIPAMKGRIEVYDIGTTIGSHTGPGTVALFFWGKKRTD